MATFANKKEIVDRLKAQIEVKDSTAIHALMFVYDNQLEDEKVCEDVKHNNGVGFKTSDAKSGSTFAKWYKEKGFFTQKQITVVKRIVKKYAGQIVNCKIDSGEIYKEGKTWIWK